MLYTLEFSSLSLLPRTHRVYANKQSDNITGFGSCFREVTLFTRYENIHQRYQYTRHVFRLFKKSQVVFLSKLSMTKWLSTEKQKVPNFFWSKLLNKHYS